MRVNKLVRGGELGCGTHDIELNWSQVDVLEFCGFGETEGEVFKLVLNALDCLQAGGLIVGCEILDSLV
jgi:hypothetical protein